MDGSVSSSYSTYKGLKREKLNQIADLIPQFIFYL